MSEARQIAKLVLPFLVHNIERRRVRSYSYYAKAIGRDPATEAIVIGPAMHAIGAGCVFRCIPVAPLHYVTRSDRSRPDVFTNAPLENRAVLEHIQILRASARIYRYKTQEFEKVLRIIDELPDDWSPHFMWHYAIVRKDEKSELTYFERALAGYREVIAAAKENKI